MHDISVLYHIVLTLDMEQSGIAYGTFATETYEIIVLDDLHG